MNLAVEKIQKITSKGQITLPVSWRRKFNVNQIVLTTKGEAVEILPLSLASFKQNEYTVFDALRDNKGRGLRAIDLLKVLEKIDK